MIGNKRIFYYDFLRAFAIFGVILCHIDGLIGYSFENLKLAIPGLFSTVGLIGVPMFFMLTGALLLNRNYSLYGFYTKRFKRILSPFIFWVTVSSVIGVICLNWSDTEVLNLIFGVNTPTWYIWNLIGIYLFMPVINSFVKEYGIGGLEVFLVIWIVTLLFNSYYPNYLKPLELSYFAGYLGYVVLGYYLDNKEFTLSDKKMFQVGILLFVTFTLINMVVFYFEIDAYTEFYKNIIIACQSAGLFLMIKYLDSISIDGKNIYGKIKIGKIGKMIVSISMCSYAMFLNHYIIICLLERFSVPFSLTMLVLLMAVAFFGSWALAYLSSKIPHIKKASGVR